MKKTLCLFLFYFSIFNSIASKDTAQTKSDGFAFTVGYLKGGGSLIGLDFEALLTKRLGLQAGAGLVGFGAGINYHSDPSINSSFVSWQFWHQGKGKLEVFPIGYSFSKCHTGPAFVFRAKKILAAQVGVGYILKTGQALEEYLESRNRSINDYPNIILTYSIGIYFTSK